jgi:hypothetical protein
VGLVSDRERTFTMQSTSYGRCLEDVEGDTLLKDEKRAVLVAEQKSILSLMDGLESLSTKSTVGTGSTNI